MMDYVAVGAACAVLGWLMGKMERVPAPEASFEAELGRWRGVQSLVGLPARPKAKPRLDSWLTSDTDWYTQDQIAAMVAAWPEPYRTIATEQARVLRGEVDQLRAALQHEQDSHRG